MSDFLLFVKQLLQRPILVAVFMVFVNPTFASGLGGKPIQSYSAPLPSAALAERQLERKKNEWRDIKAAQKQVLEKFLTCLEAAQSLGDISTCERVEKEENLQIRRAVRGVESLKN